MNENEGSAVDAVHPERPGKFRKKPVVIEAMQWDGTAEGATPIIDWVLAGGGTARYQCSDPIRCSEFDGDCPHYIAIDTLEGVMYASPGDWIIKGVAGEFYPCKPDIFAATYEPAAAPSPPVAPQAAVDVTALPEPDERTNERLDQAIIQMLFAIINSDLELAEAYADDDDQCPRDLLDHFMLWRNARLADDVADRLHDVLGIERKAETIYSEAAADRAQRMAEHEAAIRRAAGEAG